MDQTKIGTFLKELRKEKRLTQSQLTEQFNVSDRTVSRWETGSNLPDLSILVELADFYDVDVREIINGKRKSENMESELKDTLEQVAEYSNAEKEKLKKKMADVTIAATIIFLFAELLKRTNGFGCIPETPCGNLADFAEGLALGILIVNALYLTGVLEKLKSLKCRLLGKSNYDLSAGDNPVLSRLQE